MRIIVWLVLIFTFPHWTLKAEEKMAFTNLSFEFISSKSREISDEISHFPSKGIAEGAISEKKNGKDRGKILDSERIEPKTQVTNCIVDLNRSPMPPLLGLLELLDVPHDGTLESIVSSTQKRWLQPEKERWEFEEIYPSLTERALPFLEKLACVKAIHATEENYTYLLLLGAYAPRVEQRIEYMVSEWKRGVRFEKIVFLTGARFLEKERERFPTHIQTEAEMICYLWDHSDIPAVIRKLPVIIIDTPRQTLKNRKDRRPNTADTIREWLSTKPLPGKCLAISTQPMAGYQDAVLRAFLPSGFTVETIANQADPDLSFAVYLDSLARLLYQIDQ
jgi:hypothetical protein